MTEKPSLIERMKHPFFKFLWIFVYLFIVFVLFQVRKYMVLAGEGIPYTELGISVIKALVLAKVMLVAEELHLGQLSPDRPLLHPILLRSFLVALVLIAVDVLEGIIKGLLKGQGIANSLPVLGSADMWDNLLTTVILGFALIPFFGFMELGRVFGFETLKRLLFVSGTSQTLSHAPSAETKKRPA